MYINLLKNILFKMHDIKILRDQKIKIKMKNKGYVNLSFPKKPKINNSIHIMNTFLTHLAPSVVGPISGFFPQS